MIDIISETTESVYILWNFFSSGKAFGLDDRGKGVAQGGERLLELIAVFLGDGKPGELRNLEVFG